MPASDTFRLTALVATLACGHAVLAAAQTLGPGDISLRPGSDAVAAGQWTRVTDASAAGGAAMWFPDAGIPKPAAASAQPAGYFEITFDAPAGIPYRLWMRMRAQNDSWANDSVWVQFSGALSAGGIPAYRIGTTEGATVNLEEASNAGVSRWGWQDNGYGTGVFGPTIVFAASGRQVLRVQSREDGAVIDQILLSPSKYMSSAPGAMKDDGVILPASTTTPTPTVTLVRGPYLQQVGASAATVVWATREPGVAEVHYAAGGSPSTATATSRRVPASATGLSYDYYQHEAALTGLTAATSYTYDPFVSGVDVTPQAGQLRTAPAPGSGSVDFVIFGDSGTDSVEQHQIASLIAADTFDIGLHAGDITYGSTDGTGDASYAGYQNWFFNIYQPWLGSHPFFPVEGNHDSRPSNGNGVAYLDLFSLPRNGASATYPDHAERYYSFDYGPVHFVALDTEFTFQDITRRSEQIAWLDADLASTTQPWKIAFFHRSPYSAGGEHGSDLEVRSTFGPLFERYGVQLVLSAHEHIYERTLPTREGSSGSPVTYIVTGGGGGPLYPAGTAAWTAYSASRHHYLHATVGSCTLQVSAIGLDGSPFDGTTLNRCAAPPSVTLTAPSAGATFTAPATVNISATAAASGGIRKVEFYAGTTLLGTSTSAPYGFTWTNAPAGTYSLTAVATDTAGESTRSNAIAITVNTATSSTLPAGWSHGDIGATGVAGDATYSSGVYTVRGAGADVWGTADALHYAYTLLDGNGSIIARVSSIQNVNAWTKAGVMIRNGLSASAAQAFMLVASSPAKGVPFQRRPANGAASVSTSGSQSTAPRWVKLVRAGSTITGFESADGATWTTVGSDTFTMGSAVLIGLAVSSHVTGVNAAATFDNVVVNTTTAPPNVFPSVSLTSPANGATGTAPATFTLTAAASDSDGSIVKVEFFAGTTLVGTAAASPYSLNWSNVPAGTYHLTAVATDNAGAATTSAAVDVTVAAPQPPADLPPGWSSAAVGNEPFPGSATASNGTFTIKGSGADVWGTSDQFHYAYRTMSGDGSIVARVASLENVSTWVKAGVMIRETLAADSAHAFMLVSPAKGVAFQRRPGTGGVSVGTGGTMSTAPRWVKLTRAGQTFTAYESANGSAWTMVGTHTIPMGGTVLIGLAVTSHNTGATATCTFDSVTVQ